MDFALFLLLNAILLIRPGDLIPELNRAPLYYIAIIPTMLVASSSVIRQLSVHALAERPITTCVLLLLPAVMLSHMSHRLFGFALTAGYEFSQIIIYYLLLVGIVNSPGRFRVFLKWLLLFILVVTAFALAQYHGLVDFEALKELEQTDFDPITGERTMLLRLVGTGTFNDPNDLCLILSVGIMIIWWLAGESRSIVGKAFWLAASGILVYALTLTQSRGGLLAFLAGSLAVVFARYGPKKALAIGVVALPIIVVLFAGRQTNIDLGSRTDTAQARMSLWREGLTLFKENPFFGIGFNQMADEVGLVAHNSYVHAFTELGLFGATWFVGAIYLAVSSLYRLGKYDVAYPDPGHGRLRPFLFGIVVSYAMGMFSLSRNYVLPTYLVLGLTTAYLGMIPAAASIMPRFSVRLAFRLVLVSILVLFCIYLFVKVFAPSN